MLHKAWNSKGEMPYCFPRSSIKFQGHTVQNITDFYPNWAFPDCRPVAAFKSLRFALFKVIRQIARSRSSKNHRILTQIGRFRTVTPVWITNGYEMMHKAWGALLFFKVIRQISRSHSSNALIVVGYFNNCQLFFSLAGHKPSISPALPSTPCSDTMFVFSGDYWHYILNSTCTVYHAIC